MVFQMDSLPGSTSEELRKYQRLELPKLHRWFPALQRPFMEVAVFHPGGARLETESRPWH